MSLTIHPVSVCPSTPTYLTFHPSLLCPRPASAGGAAQGEAARPAQAHRHRAEEAARDGRGDSTRTPSLPARRHQQDGTRPQVQHLRQARRRRRRESSTHSRVDSANFVIEAFCSTVYLCIRIATPLAFFAMHSWEIVALSPAGNHVRHFVSSQDDTFAGLLGC